MTPTENHSPTTVFFARREALARVLGIHSVDLLIDRAVVEIGAAFPVLRLLSTENGELDTKSVEAAFASVSKEEGAAALEALNEVLVVILARLLGRRVAERLAKSLG
jgi:hypothetical protein